MAKSDFITRGVLNMDAMSDVAFKPKTKDGESLSIPKPMDNESGMMLTANAGSEASQSGSASRTADADSANGGSTVETFGDLAPVLSDASDMVKTADPENVGTGDPYENATFLGRGEIAVSRAETIAERSGNLVAAELVAAAAPALSVGDGNTSKRAFAAGEMMESIGMTLSSLAIMQDDVGLLKQAKVLQAVGQIIQTASGQEPMENGMHRVEAVLARATEVSEDLMKVLGAIDGSPMSQESVEGISAQLVSALEVSDALRGMAISRGDSAEEWQGLMETLVEGAGLDIRIPSVAFQVVADNGKVDGAYAWAAIGLGYFAEALLGSSGNDAESMQTDAYISVSQQMLEAFADGPKELMELMGQSAFVEQMNAVDLSPVDTAEESASTDDSADDDTTTDETEASGEAEGSQGASGSADASITSAALAGFN